MSLTPLINAPLLIQVHVVVAILALGLGPIAIHRKRRDKIHKYVGYVWVVAMFCLATTAAFIPSHDFAFIGTWGPIHIFVLMVYWSLWSGMRAIYRRDIATHKAALQSLYWQGLAIAGLFTFLPGRTINRVFFSESPMMGFGVIAVGAAVLIYIALRQRNDRRQRRANRMLA